MKRLDVSDNTAISMPIRNMIAIIGAVCIGVWAYFGITEQLNQHSTKLTLMEKEMEENTDSEYEFSDDGQFLVQLGAWRSEEKAQSYVDSWSDRNYPKAYVSKSGNELTGHVWFRVRVGYFTTLVSAEKFASELSTEINTDYWVINKN